jgi:hypothetical protein
MTTFTAQIAQSTDDGEQLHSSNAMTLTNTVDVLKQATGEAQYWAGRFQNVTVPSNATVSAASLSVFPTTGTNAMNGSIYGNKTGNPSTLGTTSSYISNLAFTSNSVTWNTTLTNGQFNASPDITAIINELIGQGSWASGNSMLFIIAAQSPINGCQIEEYDGSTSNCAKLSITYTVPGGPGSCSPLYPFGSFVGVPCAPLGAVTVPITFKD